MLVWDQVGQEIVISVRTFDGAAWGAPVMLDPSLYVAELKADNLGGEAVINIEALIFQPDVCNNIGNIIPGTITGNSDTADYKDTVLAPIAEVLAVANCGEVVMCKQTVPAETGEGATVFDFVHDLDVEGDADPTEFDLVHGECTDTFLVFAGQDYMVTEDTAEGYTLTAIDCSASSDTNLISDPNTATRTVTFDVAVGELVKCTFVNEAKANLTLIKAIDNACVADGGLFDLIIDGEASAPAQGNGGSLGPVELTAGTYDISEVGNGTNLDNYISTITGDGCTDDGDRTGSAVLAAGADVTCTFTNVRKPTVTVTKVLASGSGDFDLTIGSTTQNVGSGGTLGPVTISSPFNAVSKQFGPVSVMETINSAGSFQTFWSCDNATSGIGTSFSIDVLEAGENVNCTITNVPVLVVIRVLHNRCCRQAYMLRA